MNHVIAFAGQPNTGKSTLFNALTGARQHVANYPGITVEKKTGEYHHLLRHIEVVDLPGTYSLTSYSPEERVARDFILKEKPETVVNILDGINLQRQLIFTFQLLEMESPVVLYINKKDMAEKRGLHFSPDKLEHILGVPVHYGTARKKEQVKELKSSIDLSCHHKLISKYCVSYGENIEECVKELVDFLTPYQESLEGYPLRWLALKLMENDQGTQETVSEAVEDYAAVEAIVSGGNERSVNETGLPFEISISLARSEAAQDVLKHCLVDESGDKPTTTDRIDKVVLHRFFGPLILLGIMYCFYWITMVGGQKITDKVFPYFQMFRNFVSSLLPADSLLYDGFLRSLLLNGVVDGAVMILNYLPIFYVLYLVIAFLEDSGYMARIAFIMDRILRSFGLHGQSTLPMLLSGAIIGGCAVPGVMATRTIKDHNSRLVTMLVIPLLNCMAKVPFYVLMTGIFFTDHQPLVLWSFSVSTFIVALLVAKLFSSTIIKGEPEPFVLELPAYQLPTVQGVFTRGSERLWLLVKKVATIVVAVSVLIWVGVSFPRLGSEDRKVYEERYEAAESQFYASVGEEYGRFLMDDDALTDLAQFEENYKIAKRRLSAGNDQALENLTQQYVMKNPEYAKLVMKGKVPMSESDAAAFKVYLSSYQRELQSIRFNASAESPEGFYRRWMQANPFYFALVRTGTPVLRGNAVVDTSAQGAYKAWSSLSRETLLTRRDMKKSTLYGSVLGVMGKAMEPLSRIAGMNWRVNIAVIGAFAAKEALVSTLGTIYSIESDSGSEEESSLRSGLSDEGGFRPLHALAIMIFIAFFPPCIATLMMIKVESGSIKWLVFAAVYPILFGFLVASLVFQSGLLLGF